jgi:hypothetical protein
MGLDKDDIKQLIAILQKGLTDDSDSVLDDNEDSHVVEEIVKPTKKSRRNNDSNSNKSSNKKTRPKFVNKFLSMSEATMHKDDVAIDKKLNKAPPTQRSRQYQNVKVKCRVCGREESVSPALIESRDRYKCNKCSTSPG